MKPNLAWLLAGGLVVGGLTPALGAGLADKIAVEVATDVRQPGIEPGMYVCSAGHLHIRGTVRNLADVTVGQVKLAGKALDAQGKVLGTATASAEDPALKPGQTSDFDLEFVTVAGPRIRDVKKHDVRVVDAPPAR